MSRLAWVVWRLRTAATEEGCDILSTRLRPLAERLTRARADIVGWWSLKIGEIWCKCVNVSSEHKLSSRNTSPFLNAIVEKWWSKIEVVPKMPRFKKSNARKLMKEVF